MKLKTLILMMNRFLLISNIKEIKNRKTVRMLKCLYYCLEELDEVINKIFLKNLQLICPLFNLN